MAPTKNEFGLSARKVSLLFLYISYLTLVRGEDERLLIDAQINHKPVRLAFDTGSTFSALWYQTATNLGLSISNQPAERLNDSNSFPYTVTGPCTIDVAGMTIIGNFAVIDVPGGVHPNMDGLLGWPALKANFIQFDFVAHSFKSLEELPKSISKWAKFQLSTNCDILVLEVTHKHGESGCILMDTGKSDGVSLNSEDWRKWTLLNPIRPRTIDASYNPQEGMTVREITWVTEISFGDLAIHEVSLHEANAGEFSRLPEKFLATFGMEALKHFDFIVDERQKVAYLRPRDLRFSSFQHNRTGVTFLPDDQGKGDNLIARVLEGTPAYEAGIRNGDVLLKINDEDFSNWRSRSTDTHYLEQPAGTKLHITMRANGKEYEATIVLRDLIGPNIRNKNQEP